MKEVAVKLWINPMIYFRSVTIFITINDNRDILIIEILILCQIDMII